jgi:hypothetical protein
MKRQKQTKISKGTVVWYWNRHVKKWKKGKVISVNRWGLTIQERQLKRRLIGAGGVLCTPASEPKPELPPDQYNAWEKIRSPWRHYWGYNDEQYKIMQRLGIRPSEPSE